MKWITIMDFLGTKPTLNIRGQNNYKTTLGGALSIIVLISIISGASYFINQLLSKSNFTIIQSEEYYPLGYMNWTNYEIAVNLANKVGEKIPEADRIYSIKGLWYSYEKNNNSNSSQVEMETKLKFFDMEYCDLSRHFTNSSNLWKEEKFISSSFCLPKDYPLNISQIFTSVGNKGILISLTRCSNTTTKKNCFSPERIEKDLENVIVLIRMKNFYFDHKLTGDTGVPYIFTHSPTVSSSVVYKSNYFFQNFEYFTDESLLFSSSNKRLYNVIGESRQTSDLTKDTIVPGSFVMLNFNMHSMKKNVNKNYYKFQNMLADLGGLIKGIITVAGFINIYFSNLLFYKYIINQNNYSLINQNFPLQEKTPARDDKFNGKFSFNKVKNSQIILKHDISCNDSNEINNIKDIKFSNLVKNLNEKQIKHVSSLKLSSNNEPKNSKNTKEVKNSVEKIYMNQNLNLRNVELYIPTWCLCKNKSKKNSEFYNNLCELVKNKFEMSHLFNKLCNLDKLEYIICGEEINLLNLMFNPAFHKDGNIPIESEENLIRQTILKYLLKNEVD